MKKTIISIFIGVVLVSAPVSASVATIDELQAQIKSLLELVETLQQQLEELKAENNNLYEQKTAQCTEIHVSLSSDEDAPESSDYFKGVRLGYVKKLQTFLQNTGDFTYNSVTGYYGFHTIRAVQLWQKRNGIIDYGEPETTGYGTVGPKTRAAMSCISPLKDEIDKTIHTEATSVSQCRTAGIGGESCGRFVNVIIYSVEATDEDRLFGLLEQYNELSEESRKEYIQRFGISLPAVCADISRPKLELRDGKCSAVEE